MKKYMMFITILAAYSNITESGGLPAGRATCKGLECSYNTMQQKNYETGYYLPPQQHYQPETESQKTAADEQKYRRGRRMPGEYSGTARYREKEETPGYRESKVR